MSWEEEISLVNEHMYRDKTSLQGERIQVGHLYDLSKRNPVIMDLGNSASDLFTKLYGSGNMSQIMTTFLGEVPQISTSAGINQINKEVPSENRGKIPINKFLK